MSNTFQHDPLEVLNRAQRSADEWWSNTLNNAKKRTDLDQTHLDNAFKNDERAVTYAPKIWATNAENIYKGTKAQYDTMLEPDRYVSGFVGEESPWHFIYLIKTEKNSKYNDYCKKNFLVFRH